MKINRRNFIYQLSSGAALSLLPLSQTSYAKSGNKMQFGLVTYLWAKDWSLPILIENCEKSGVVAVELRVDHAHNVSPALNAEEREAVKNQFKQSKVKVMGMGTNAQFDNPDPEILKKNIEEAKAFIMLSHDIGGTGVKVKPNQFHEGVSHEKTLEQIGNSLDQIGTFGADYGQQIRLEVHGRGTQLLPNIKKIMDVADNPNVTVCWNCNAQDLEGEGLVYNFNLVKNQFGDTVHVREFNVGDYPYQRLFDLLVKMDYQGYILMEARTDPKDKVAALIEQRKLMQDMITKAQQKL
jgi:sugar phosphate isomerase/epimerase